MDGLFLKRSCQYNYLSNSLRPIVLNLIQIVEYSNEKKKKFPRFTRIFRLTRFTDTILSFRRTEHRRFPLYTRDNRVSNTRKRRRSCVVTFRTAKMTCSVPTGGCKEYVVVRCV